MQNYVIKHFTTTVDHYNTHLQATSQLYKNLMLLIVQHMGSHLFLEKKEVISDFQSDYLMANLHTTLTIFAEETEVHHGHSLKRKNMAKMNLSNMSYVLKILLLKIAKRLR